MEVCRMFGTVLCVLVAVNLAESRAGRCGAICELGLNTNLASNLKEPIQGNITFTRDRNEMNIYVEIEGFDTTDAQQYHGIHLHSFTDDAKSCDSFGGHFNPDKTNHGAPADPITMRHAGDLGNIKEDGNGKVSVVLKDMYLRLDKNHKYNVVGRSIVIHKGADDMGKGGNNGSLATGNAGKRLACCDIKRMDCGVNGTPVSASASLFVLMFCFFFII